MSAGPAINLQGAGKTYGEVVAVADLSIAVAEGEWLTLLGPSGCGKTTTLRMIAGFIAPDTGRVEINGRDVTRIPPERRGLGVVFQDYALFPHMTVYDNVAYGLRRRHRSKAEIRDRVASVLSLVRLAGFERRKPNELSGGQQQRVALARAIAIEPAALLLDEPLSNLDAALRDEMRVELRELQQRLGIATVFVTHDQEEALALSDRVVLLNRGRAVQDGTPQALFEEPSSEFSARFMRFRNVLSGRRLAAGPGWIDVQLPGGSVVRARSGTQSNAEPETISVAIRPERLQFDDREGVEGIVEEETYLGGESRYAVSTAAGLLMIRSSDVGLARGSSVHVRFPALAAVQVNP